MKAVLFFVVVLVLVAGLAYASDYGVGGTVEKKGQNAQTGAYYVNLGLDLGPSVKRELEQVQWNCLEEGNYVVYHLRSGHTLIYEKKGGRKLFDSEVPGVPEACLQGGGGGGGSGFPFLGPAP